ncbi:MAG TPA: ADOP family duplicated permease [Bryobacteraceae bacterium]|nr:ADOP family duplicated permease [Bryobacteraceae bacterium]
MRFSGQGWRELAFAARSLLRSPVFGLAVIVSLALGIGANTAVFSLLDTLVFRPLPVREPRQLVHLGSFAKNGMPMPLPKGVIDGLRNDPLLQGVCGFTAGDATIEAGSNSAVVATLSLTGDCYQTLGVKPSLGRLLTPSDDRFDGPKVAVLGYRFWQTKFGGNPAILGSMIKISGVPFEIVGVTEKRFEGLVWGYPASVSAPISQRTIASAQDPSGHFYWADTLGRLQSGIGERALKAHLKTEWRRLYESALPPAIKGAGRNEILSELPMVASGATGVDYYFREHFQSALFALLAISLLVLLVSCVNISNLMLARGLGRQREIAIRLALGAARFRILRQLLAESTLLLVAGFGFAFLLAIVSAREMAGFFIGALGRSDASFPVEIDWRVLLFTAAVAIVAVLLFAMLPAWRTSNVDPSSSLNSGSRSVTGSRAGPRKLLLIGQVALTFLILVTASVFLESVTYLRNHALGFDGANILDAQLMPGSQVLAAHKPANDGYLSSFLDAIGAIPGVRGVSLSSFAPLVDAPFKEDVRPLNQAYQNIVCVPAEFATEGFLGVMHVPLLAGREFRRSETPAMQRTAIVSRSVADNLFPGTEAIGKHIQFGSEPETRDVEIIGVAADRKLEDPHMTDGGYILLSLWQLPRMADWANLQVSFSGSAPSIASALRREIAKAGRQQVFLMSTMSDLRDRSLLQDRLLAVIGRTYVMLVLVLTALGLVGLLLFFVSSREKEIAIRVAVGAERHDIRSLVAREAAFVTAAGLLMGIPASYLVVRGLSGLLYGVPPTLLGPWTTSVAVTAAVATVAVVVPMFRATSIDPNTALRSE